MSSVVNRLLSQLFAALVVGLLAAASAGANGPCGQDFDGNHACGVNSPGQYSGSLTTDNELDYYVFNAQKGTELSVSITDTENPGCYPAPWPTACGNVRVGLLDANGNDLGEGASSTINNGITVPGTFSHTLDAAGTDYLVVSGSLGQNANSNPTSVPYTQSVNASPAVQWPPPPPTTTNPTTTTPTTTIHRRSACRVPMLKGLTLASARTRLTHAHCKLGIVQPSGHRRRDRQRVMHQSLAAGSVDRNGTRVSITLR